jgi:hypothetical protein
MKREFRRENRVSVGSFSTARLPKAIDVDGIVQGLEEEIELTSEALRDIFAVPPRLVGESL